jgi:hypothetical protein
LTISSGGNARGLKGGIAGPDWWVRAAITASLVACSGSTAPSMLACEVTALNNASPHGSRCRRTEFSTTIRAYRTCWESPADRLKYTVCTGSA